MANFTFDELNKEMNKISALGSTMNESAFSEVTDYIPTGNYHLNACMTGSIFKGVPNNRAICFAGSSGTGKTFLLLNAIREAQKKGYYIVFYDSEAAVDRELMEKFDIDTSRVRYEPCATVQEFRTSVTNLTESLITNKRKGIEIPKLMIALDSAGNLATLKELDDAQSGSQKADMSRAKIMKSIFRILMNRLAECKIPMIFTNHTYQTQSFISQTKAGGGTGPEYAASIILFLSKAQLKEAKEKTGIIVTAKPNKNRFARPHPIKFYIHYSKGMNEYVGLENYVNWELCGITKGKKDKKTGELIPSAGSNKWIVKHLDRTVTNSEFFTPEVFTEEVLKKIDEHIQPIFNYGIDDSIPEELISIGEDLEGDE